MRPLLTFLTCLMLVATIWGGAAQAAVSNCVEATDQVSMHMAGDCDEVPADAHKNYPHCHTACHGHYVMAPMPVRGFNSISIAVPAYASATPPSFAGRHVDQTLRPPQA